MSDKSADEDSKLPSWVYWLMYIICGFNLTIATYLIYRALKIQRLF